MKKDDIIKHFQILFTCEQFVVTGSYALQKMGLINNSNDLDIILVNPSVETISILEKSSKDYSSNKFDEYKNKKVYIFKQGNIKIDVFVEKNKQETLSLKEGYEISMICNIIDIKKSYGRPKDYMQLLSLSRKFITMDEIYKYCDVLFPSILKS